MNDKTIITHLWWLRKHLNEQYKNKEFKEVVHEELSEDIAKELDGLVSYIKLNY